MSLFKKVIANPRLSEMAEVRDQILMLIPQSDPSSGGWASKEETAIDISTQLGWLSAHEVYNPLEDMHLYIVKMSQDISELKQIVLERNISFSCQIFELNSDKYTLLHPLSAIVSEENKIYTAEFVDFDIFGTGDDEKDAIDDLKKAFVIYFESLTSSESNLSKKLNIKLRTLKKIIKSET